MIRFRILGHRSLDGVDDNHLLEIPHGEPINLPKRLRDLNLDITVHEIIFTGMDGIKAHEFVELKKETISRRY